METSLIPQSNHIARQIGFNQSASVYNSTDLTVRTREGDLVTISSNKQLAYSESARKTRFENGEIVEEFSSMALAASEYSLIVQGDLNEEELAAIEKLVSRISPMAQSFFNQSGFDVGEAVKAFTESPGVIEQVSLKLNKTQVQTASSQFYFTEEVKNLKEAVEEELSDVKSSNIRNLRDLLAIVLGAAFKDAEKEFTEDNQFLESLTDMTRFYHSQLLPLLEPLTGKINELLPENNEPDLPIVKEPQIKTEFL